MTQKGQRLTTALSSEDLKRLQAEADELTKLQEFLNQLPMGIQVETLSDDALARLREVVASPETELAGSNLLLWNNTCRIHSKLTN